MKINYDVEGEISLLGSCLLLNDCLYEACQALSPEHFYDPVNQMIFHAILDIYKDGSQVNLDSLVARLKVYGTLDKTKSVIPKLMPYSSSGTYQSHIKNILFNHSKTKIANCNLKLSQDFEEKSIHEIAKICDDHFNNTSLVNTYTLQDIAEGEFFGCDNFEQWLETRHKEYQEGKHISGLSTGFFELDNIINGLNPSHYIIVAGQPGSGKSTFAIQMMKNLMQTGNKCGFISLEMTKEQAFIKLICDETGLNFKQVIRCALNEFQKQQILESMHRLKKNQNLFIQDGQIENLMALRARIKHLVHVKGIQVLFVDYITLIRTNMFKLTLAEQIQQTSSEIRALLNELKIPGVIISQLNRSAADRESPPDKHHLFGSGQLEKDAHEILMLHPDPLTQQRKLYIRKNRFGEENQVIQYEFKNGHFSETPRHPLPGDDTYGLPQ